MDIEKLIKRLYCPQIHSCPMDGEYPSCSACQKMLVEDIATALSTLQAENEKLRAELEQVKAEHDAAVEYLRGQCRYCKRHLVCTSRKGPHSNCWEWRGQKEERE